jgi:hypothetical protein
MDYTDLLGKDLSRGLSNIAKRATNDGLALGLSIDVEDVASELYMVLLARPALYDYPLFKTLSILKGEATKYVNDQRRQVGGFFTNPEALISILADWRSEGLPTSVSDALYGPVFVKAGVPAGSYLQAIQDAYWDGAMPARRSAADFRLRRAVVRLTEVLSGVMVRQVCLDEAEQLSYLLPEGDDDLPDATFNAFDCLYVCEAGHLVKVRVAVDKPQRLGTPKVYGYRNCPCGMQMQLAE